MDLGELPEGQICGAVVRSMRQHGSSWSRLGGRFAARGRLISVRLRRLQEAKEPLVYRGIIHSFSTSAKQQTLGLQE